MGDFLEDLGKRITETAEAVSKKTSEVVELQKLKSQIRTLERQNERDFQDMGELVYEKFKQGETLDDCLLKLCGAVQERDVSVKEYEKQIAEIKGKDICPDCKNHLEPGMLYCPKCGAKVEEDIFEEEFEDELKKESDAFEHVEGSEETAEQEENAEEEEGAEKGE